jgi:hypothetical protein
MTRDSRRQKPTNISGKWDWAKDKTTTEGKDNYYFLSYTIQKSSSSKWQQSGAYYTCYRKYVIGLKGK